MNFCLRLINRVTTVTSDFAGTCKSIGYADGPILQAKFGHVVDLLKGKDSLEHLIFVVDRGFKALRNINTKTGLVHTIEREEFFDKPSCVLLDTERNNSLLVFSSTVIKRVEFEESEDVYHTTTIFSNTETRNTIDGRLSESTLYNVEKVVLLRQEVFVLTQYSTEISLRVLDLKNKTVSSICMGSREFKAGLPGSCALFRPFGLLISKSVLYIGSIKGIFAIPSKTFKIFIDLLTLLLFL